MTLRSGGCRHEAPQTPRSTYHLEFSHTCRMVRNLLSSGRALPGFFGPSPPFEPWRQPAHRGSLRPVSGSLDVLLHAAAVTARYSIPAIGRSLARNPDPRRSDPGVLGWARDLVSYAQVDIVARGIEHLDPGQVYVVMSNHRSLYDIPVVLDALRIPLRMVAKKELFSIPIMGGGMRGAGFIEINRDSGRDALKSLDKAKDSMLRHGLSVWIAPEGTRSGSGELGEFKRGGFMLAWHAGIPILPISLSGTEQVLPARARHVRKGCRVEVTVSPAINPRDYSRRDIPQLMQQVRDAIARPLHVG